MRRFRRRARIDHHGMPRSHPLGELALERANARAHRQPSGAEHIDGSGQLLLPEGIGRQLVRVRSGGVRHPSPACAGSSTM